ncbi:MAG: hypothetical protein FWH57_05670 [Oscillospiraceae bacterium]|nr:hypothetical protein [Oscillospiraceae bacterium]
MRQIILDDEFQFLLPALDEETYKSLEESIILYGCMYPLVVWDGVLVDGYNRHRICTEHGIAFETIEKDFDSREDALIWIIKNQVARRNLSQMQLSYYRGLHYNADKKSVGNNSDALQRFKEQLCQNGTIPITQSTATRLAEQYKVSRRTISRDAKLSTAIDALGESSPEAKRMLLSGELKLNKKDLAELSSMNSEEIQGIAAEIENGTYEKRPAVPTQPADIAPTQQERSPVDLILAGITPLNTADSLADVISSQLQNISALERTQLKSALRVYIDLLEVLYVQI